MALVKAIKKAIQHHNLKYVSVHPKRISPQTIKEKEKEKKLKSTHIHWSIQIMKKMAFLIDKKNMNLW